MSEHVQERRAARSDTKLQVLTEPSNMFDLKRASLSRFTDTHLLN